MQPIIIANTLPERIIALSESALQTATELTAKASTLAVEPTAASLEAGNSLYRQIDTHTKGIAACRLDITRPIDALKAAIIEAERKATEPMQLARTALGLRIAKADSEMRRIAEEAARKAREEAEAKAKAERDRLEAERQALIAQQEVEHQAAADEAALFGTEPPPAAEPPPPVVVVPIVETPAQLMAPLPKCAVRTNVRKVLFIHDARQIPREISGAVLLEPNERAIKKLLEAGIAVPGCELINESSVGSAGSRGAA
jgi:hypothetical protein